MKKLFSILFISLFIFSCDEDSNPVGPENEPDGYVFLWGSYYNIEGTTELDTNDDGNDNYFNVDCQNLVGQSIPSEIGQLVNLRSIDLTYCGLEGEIPSEIENLTNLTRLELNNNQLTGEIPVEIGNITNLGNLYLNNNELTGQIPSVICNLGFIYTNVGNNKLCPPYPSCISQSHINSQDTSDCP